MNRVIERSLLYKRLCDIEVEDTLFFPLRENETSALAAQRIRARVAHMPQGRWRWRCRPAATGVWVTKGEDRMEIDG